MAATLLEIGGTDYDTYVQTRSIVVRFNSMDVVLIDPSTEPDLQDTITVIQPAWTGKVKGIETSTYQDGAGNDHRYLKITGKNQDVLSNDGAASWNLSDTPNLTTTFPWKDKTLQFVKTRSNHVNEKRAKVTVLKHGLWPGEEITITSAAEGWTARQFTIMEITLRYPTNSLTYPEYDLDLGDGDFENATHGGTGGGLGPTTTICDCVCTCGECVVDTEIDYFERTEAAGSLGSTSWGGAWAIGTLTSTSTVSVDGDNAVLVGGHSGGTANGYVCTLSGSFPGGSYPWGAGVFSARVKFKLSANGTGEPYISFNFGSTGNTVDMYLQHGDTLEFGIIRGAGTDTVVPGSLTIGAFYYMDMEYDQPNGIHRGRLYLTSVDAPAWQVSRDSTSDTTGVPAGMKIDVQPAADSVDVTYTIESILASTCVTT